MSMFNKNRAVLSNEMMDKLQALLENDAYYQEHKGTHFDNRPQNLQKLKATLRVQQHERVLMYMDDGLLTHGRNGMIATEQGIYYKGLMETAKFTSWNELMSSPINIYCNNGTPISLRVKVGFGHRPFCNALDGDGCADFWIRIKQAIAGHYSAAKEILSSGL